ncbi:MAG TPA: tRNA uridine-5-carboxymethylaminomethyl(34) synthesis GTPase MnmE [Lentisphaeria bacterium]|nr:MAG: tRNA uridine-5-carboxymethylaminomethyl(34) synthesis GTPase MnmE [Lentisphaerae bacterium GWF2_50_93]HCE45859.1 tRNA uridine-5-carboxymethylaminomethyl(34) synthesis GTPase MnmE [Lentisphaeria bacterium]
MNNSDDTIAAISTGTGGAVSIIRISGHDTLHIARSVWHGMKELGPENKRTMMLGKCTSPDNKFFEQAVAVFFPGPNSYTGEDLVEIHCHGGTLVSRKVLELLLNAGARQADPGEFTCRAFMNGKLDLTQAEGVSEIISAQSGMALNLAERQTNGILGNTIHEIRSSLVHVLSECESRLDFPEENLDWAPAGQLCANIDGAVSKIKKLLEYRTEGAVLREGVRIVIAGKPNVGKSSLLNLMLGYDRAIVTPLPGTTRDTVEEHAVIRNIPVRLIDTAGIREADNIIEGKGIERSIASIRQAQIIIWLLDASADHGEEIRTMREHLSGRTNVIAVWNKIDLLKISGKLPPTGLETAEISVDRNTGMEKLLDMVEKHVWGYPHADEPETAVSTRHSSLLEEALEALPDAIGNIKIQKWELSSVNLHSAISALGRITGEDASPDVLDEIFSRFCIGK